MDLKDEQKKLLNGEYLLTVTDRNNTAACIIPPDIGARKVGFVVVEAIEQLIKETK
jgi:hypothetical protein